MKVVAVVLAAGKATRMGRNKLALPLGQDTVGGKTVSAALATGIDHVVVCLSPHDCGSWLQLVKNHKVSIVPCNQADKGQAYTLQAGVEKATRLQADAIIVLLGDQPFIAPSLIRQILEKAKTNVAAHYVAACFQQMERPPILFRKEIFPQLMRLKGDEGARKLVRSQKGLGLTIHSMDEANFVDLDTKEDYTWACKQLIT